MTRIRLLFVGLLGFAVWIVGSSAGTASQPDDLPRTLIKVSHNGVHWKVKFVSRHDDGSASHGVGQVIEGGEVTGRMLTASGAVASNVRAVRVRRQDSTGTQEVVAPVRFISREDAKALGVKRFGWWGIAIRPADFDGTTTATAIGKGGRVLGQSSVLSEEDEFTRAPAS